MSRRSIIILLVGVLFLCMVGIVMLMSTSVFSAHADETNVYREAKRQTIWLGIGALGCWIASVIDYHFWKKWVWVFLVGTGGLLVLCYVPGIGILSNGERRWIDLGPLRIQPSELAKLTIVFFLAYWYSRFPDCGRHFVRGFVTPLCMVGMVIALILFEVDIGTTAVLGFAVLIVLFVAGVKKRYLTSLVGLGIAVFIGMMSYAPNRIARIAAFIDPEGHKLGTGFQQWISLMAIGSGGLTGRGLGEGRLKMLYMPFAHTDFIFPMIGEELGLIGTMLVILAFISIVCSGMVIAMNAPDRFGLLIATGICTLLAVQAFFNIAVTTSMLPNTGLPLPFVSYGGSSLVISLASIGILINIYRQGRYDRIEPSDWALDQHRETPRMAIFGEAKSPTVFADKTGGFAD